MDKDIIKIGSKDLQVKQYKGQRVVTFKDVDMVHERAEGTANKRFLDNKKHFIESVDYFSITGEELKQIKQLPNFGICENVNKLFFLTETGYLMLVKSLQDDLAWEVQR
ncbi:MAG: ORF6N domain-containing protein, partial [Clostridium sp.]